MYKTHADHQITFFDFNQSCGMQLDMNNRWVLAAARIPWAKLEEKYAEMFPSKTGCPAKPLRMALGSLILQKHLGLSDRKLVAAIAENPYYQYFIGLDAFQKECPFRAPSLVSFRKRLDCEFIMKANELYLSKAGATQEHQQEAAQGQDKGAAEENVGTAILDATCSPSNIKYPQDFELLNTAREKLEQIIDRMQKESRPFVKPRTYKRIARKEYLALAKSKKRTAKKIRRVIRKQLGYVRRDLGYIERYLAAGCTLTDCEKTLLETIRKLYEQLDAIEFKPDYLCVIMDRERDYMRACKGFTINGMRYHRLLGTNGGIKNETIVFASDRHGDELRRRIENGRDQAKELVPAKFEAYKALTCSASSPVSMPNGVLVVPDCETEFIADTIYLNDEEPGEPIMEDRPSEKVTLDESDGYGIMLPSLAERWAGELGLDYVPSGVNTRFSFEKGMVFTFDFREFAEQVAGSYLVKDAWGTERDVRDAELILTTSMVKLWDSYPSCEAYLRCCAENGYTFGVAKVCPRELENERTLNYQFIQSYDLTPEDVDELIAPTMEEIREILYADYNKTVLFLKGSGLTDENIESTEDDFAKALMARHNIPRSAY